MSKTTEAIRAEITEKPWWKLDRISLLLVVGAGIFSVGLSLCPSLFDRLWVGFWYLAEYRQWPRWYFCEILIVLAFSMRWFFLYVSHVNDELTSGQRSEAVAFVKLAGFAAAAMLVLTVLHRAGIARLAYYSLYAWFGFGAFSLAALLSFSIILTLITVCIVLFGKWFVALKTNS